VFSDQEKRIPGGQGRQQHRFQRFPAEQTEGTGQRRTDFAVPDRWVLEGAECGGFGRNFADVIGYAGYESRTGSTKKIRRPSSGGGKSVEIFVRKIALPHIDL